MASQLEGLGQLVCKVVQVCDIGIWLGLKGFSGFIEIEHQGLESLRGSC